MRYGKAKDKAGGTRVVRAAVPAACQALDTGVPVQDIDYPAALRARLEQDGHILAWKP